MSWPLEAAPCLTAVRIGLLALLMTLPLEAGAAMGAALTLEPGFVTESGDWLVPIGLTDDIGNPLDVPENDLRVSLNGLSIEDYDLGVFAPEPGGYASSIIILLDGGFPSTGTGPVAAFLGSGSATAKRGLFLMGSPSRPLLDLGEKAPAEETLFESLADHRTVRLWDSILEAITVLDQEGAVRKVLFLVSDGQEDQPSEHPLATCIEAALRTRVAVHVIERQGSAQDLARLRELARRTGGISVPYADKGSIRRSLARLDAMRALRVSPAKSDLPAELEISFGFSAEAVGTVQIARQKALTGPNLLLLVGMGLGVIAVTAAAVVLYRTKTRTVGYLLLAGQPLGQEHAFGSSGVTVGSGRDNQLVLDDQRISRHHAVIRVQGDEVILTDLRSASGTWVNGQQVRNASLFDGDQVLLGGAVEMTFRRQRNRAGDMRKEGI